MKALGGVVTFVAVALFGAACSPAARENPDGDIGPQADAADDDLDDDDDGVPDTTDNCPEDSNPDQLDTDGDGLGDACDSDDDDDGVVDLSDNCKLTPNTDQSDLDDDQIGDACDDDDDNDTILDPADNCATVPNTDQADDDANMVGNACQGVLNPQISGKIPGGHLYTVGLSTAGRYDGMIHTDAPLPVVGLPDDAIIVHAWLYWAVIGTTATDLNLDGQPVTGRILGITPDTCWGIGLNTMYRADVTEHITGNGTYTVTGLPSAASGPDSQGISLAVIYRDPNDPRTNFVEIKDGALYVQGVPMTTLLELVPVPDSFETANVTYMVADAQPAADTLQIDTIFYGGDDAFPGNVGAMWDVRVDDITANLPSSDLLATVTTTVTAVNDCVAPLFAGIEVTNIGTVIIEKAGSYRPRTPLGPRPALPAVPRRTAGTAGVR
jgi:hypothetical protein